MAQLQGGSSGAPFRPPPVKPPPQEDPFAILEQLMAQQQSSTPDVDYMAQAQKMYEPQFGHLDKMSADAKARADAERQHLSGLYNALSGDIMGMNKGIGDRYDKSVGEVNSAYNSALQSTDRRFDQSDAEAMEQLKRLGIQQAGGNVFGKSAEAEKLLMGIIQANGQGSANQLREGKQSALTHNTNTSNAAKMAGGEAQRGVGKQLSDFLNQLGLKRAELQSQASQTGFSMEADEAKSRQASQQAGLSDAYGRYKDQRDFAYRQGKDKADYDLKIAGMTGDKQKLDPLGEVQQLATQLYPNQQAASNAMRVLTGAVTDMGGEVPSLGALMQYIRTHLMERNGRFGDEAQMQRLAALLWENTLDN